MNVNGKLCTKDPRNPMYHDLYEYDDEKPEPRKDCACDNCFYGRDELALEIIGLKSRLEAADRLADASENVNLECDNFHHSISHQHALFEECLPMIEFEAALRAYRADGGDDESKD